MLRAGLILTLEFSQSETLKYLYLLFSDPNTLPFEGECYKNILYVRELMGLSLVFIALLCRLRVHHRGKRGCNT
jgi:hypothetical protein